MEEQENRVMVAKNQFLATNGYPVEVVSIGKQIYRFNTLRSFPLSDEEIIEWSTTLFELKPEYTPLIIKKAIDGMILQQLPYDKSLGIQNIIQAIKILDGTEFLDRL